jgi:hypothetical protein
MGGLISAAGIMLGCVTLCGFVLVKTIQKRKPSDFMGDLLVNFLFFGLMVLWARIYILGRRMSQLSAEEAIARDPRPPILLLRSFSDDHSLRVKRSGMFAKSPLTAMKGDSVGFEEILVRVLADFGPVLAIGRPGEALPPIGAARTYVPEGMDWKEVVRALANKSAWIVMVLGASEGFHWELEMVLGLGSPEKVVIVVPRLVAKLLQPRWEALLEEFRGHGHELPPNFHPETVLLTFSEHWKPVFSLDHGLELSSESAQYEEHFRHALAGLMRQS